MPALYTVALLLSLHSGQLPASQPLTSTRRGEKTATPIGGGLNYKLHGHVFGECDFLKILNYCVRSNGNSPQQTAK